MDEVVDACSVSKKTVIKVKKCAAELGISWTLSDDMTDEKLETILFPKTRSKSVPNVDLISITSEKNFSSTERIRSSF